MYHYNLKKLFNENEIIPEINYDQLQEELQTYGTVNFVKYNDNGFKLYLSSFSEIFDLDPIKQIILNHKALDGLKAAKIGKLKSNSFNKINSKYPYYKQLNQLRAQIELALGIQLNGMFSEIDSIRDLVDAKETEINSKIKESTLAEVDISLN